MHYSNFILRRCPLFSCFFKWLHFIGLFLNYKTFYSVLMFHFNIYKQNPERSCSIHLNRPTTSMQLQPWEHYGNTKPNFDNRVKNYRPWVTEGFCLVNAYYTTHPWHENIYIFAVCRTRLFRTLTNV